MAQEELQGAYEQLQRTSSRELSKMRRQCDAYAQELQQHADEVTTLRAQLVAKGSDGKQVERLRGKLLRLEQQSTDERAALQRALDKHKKEVILLNSELARSKRDEDRARRHAQQLDGELKMLQRRSAASRAPVRGGGGTSARTASSYRASSAPGSRQGSRAPSAERWQPASGTSSRHGSYAGSRGSSVLNSTAASRANSVNSVKQRATSSTAASRANSVNRGSGAPSERSYASSRALSQASSRASSRAPSRGSTRSSVGQSRPSSADRSRPSSRDPHAPISRGSSRASSTERSQPPSRGSQPSQRAPPSLEHAARAALLQTARARRRARTGEDAPRERWAARDAGRHRDSGDDSSDFDADELMLLARGVHDKVQPKDAAGREAHKENRARGEMPPQPHARKGLCERREEVPSGQTYDATQDINDIDRRLNALQDFLKAAKVPR